MTKAAICFTTYGKSLIERLNEAAEQAGIEKVQPYISMKDSQLPQPETQTASGTDSNETDFRTVTVPLSVWASQMFERGNALIFVGAAGIAVRAIAPSVKDKLIDSPVIVIDDLGNFVIPILSGHAGGGNKLAVTIAALIGAQPVITTSTDIHGAFSADVFARENNLSIRNRDGIKKVSAKAIEGKPVTLTIKDYPSSDSSGSEPFSRYDIVIADETDLEYSLLLSPKKYTLGIGMKKGTDIKKAEDYIIRKLIESNIITDDIYAVCTIDIKQEEPAIRAFCDKYRLPLLSFDAALLNKAEGDFTSSQFVKQTTGVDNVCERAALMGAGPGAELTVRKTAENGITLAIGKRNIQLHKEAVLP